MVQGNDSADFVAVDWGTSRMRLWPMRRDGSVLGERRADDGLEAGRQRGFSAILENHLAELGVTGETPVVVCGMAGSRQGWKEAAYVEVPAPLEKVLADSVAPDAGGRAVRILPGMAQRGDAPDVMRGEETQLLGLVLKTGLSDALVAMPGTHSKWVTLSGGAVAGFSTVMTGELFQLLAEHSILRHSIGDAAGGVEAGQPAFSAGLEAGLRNPAGVLQGLFGIRAASLLEGLPPGDAAACLSGLLIGAEIGAAAGSKAGNAATILVASGRMERLYRAGMVLAGLTPLTVDADEVVRMGLLAAARGLWLGGEA
ncbi:MAG: 2-dehydro-3-deoxygalactonokinase [Rhizobiaceae bacterium]|nr:2-dehydro-3-deoxygalactonokinase [Rhizobiaceae bacterium]